MADLETAALVLASCRLQAGTEGPEALRRCLGQDPDWRRVAALAASNGVLPIVCHQVQQHGADLLPSAVAAALGQQRWLLAGHALTMTAELLRVVDVLAGAGVEAMPLKGPVLALRVHGDVSLRQAVDLDLLVEPAQAERGRDALLGIGYQQRPHLSGPKSEAEYAYRLVDPDRNAVVELHWALTLGMFGLDLSPSQLRARADTVELAGRRLPCLEVGDLLLALAMHLGKHCWEERLRLCWVNDVAGVIANAPTQAWPGLLERARRLGCRRVLNLSLALCESLLRVQLPEPLAQSLRADPLAAVLAGRVAGLALGDPPQAEPYDFDVFLRRTAFYMALREGRRHRAGYGLHYLSFGLRWAFRPNGEDRRRLPLPRGLGWAHYGLRPLRLLLKHRARLAAGVGRVARVVAGPWDGNESPIRSKQSN